VNFNDGCLHDVCLSLPSVTEGRGQRVSGAEVTEKVVPGLWGDPRQVNKVMLEDQEVVGVWALEVVGL
jgi:hypothetical protein